ncbi:DNA polymerase alpha catalytic subunit A [Cyberlindnera fabianii]|uniref:DNA polymerase n=1 Tax=Cyberlindnera fabianii TaxID=36022 RepID=A0A1V2L9F2_CYBFA|nr:DNA polymerase alpha catalytic subunit A [Cyberlindnera fabianii]
MGRADKLAALRAARAAGTSRHVYEEEETEDIYDLVDEDQYREKRRDDLLKDDFVIDDNGEGYVDTGVDEWDGKRHSYSSDEEEFNTNKTSKKSKKQIPVKKSAPINSFFKTSAATMAAPKKKTVSTDFDDILGDFASPAQKKKPMSMFTTNTTKTPLFNSTNKVNNSLFFSKSSEKKQSLNLKKSVKPSDFDDFDLDSGNVSFEKLDSSPTRAKRRIGSQGKASTPEPTPETVKEEVTTMDVDEEESDEDDIVVVKRPRVSTTAVNRSVNLTAAKANEPKEERQISSPPPSSPMSAANMSTTDKVDKDLVAGDDDADSFKMYWLDYVEHDNTLLLFGKTLTKDNQYVSTMVQITNFNRELFFLPRDFRRVDGEDTDEAVSAMDVHEEIAPLIMGKFGLDSLKAKPEVKKYAFEKPGIPKEKEYLKMLLPFNPPKNARTLLPADLEGETFSHVFGTNSSVFETFVLQRNIMGPCWLEIKNGDFTALKNSSHCKVEVQVTNPNFITPIERSTSEFKVIPPPLTCCSITVKTMMNQKENKQEVVAVTLSTYKDLPQDAPVSEDLLPTEQITLTRPIGVSLPPGLKMLADQSRLPLRVFNSEKTMLNCLAALVKVADPDVFIGHRLENIAFDILMHRMHDLKVMTFSNFGRRSRKEWPDRFGKTNYNSNFILREIFAGRLLCDIANEMGQSLTTKCQSWELPEMYEVVCKKKLLSPEYNLNNPVFQEDAKQMLLVLKDNAQNSTITAEIAFRIQILSLSKQLTNLAGNAWSHTLGGTRAGRNEYILLHEFTRNNYIVPDKESRKTKQQQQEALRQQQNEDAGDEQQISNTTKKGAKYQGGLVFEPEKGLHKNYVLVMDFNSLYPSIIQEFNICFTTVERDASDIDALPEVPATSVSQGVLPRLLNTLVTRRREVKKLLKDPSSTPIERAQYDIKQQALKLTANSMYGCLGYVNSRFYAQPLAMLVTNKGREILMDTRQLAESLGLRVVYGDTDSVMIDTGCDTLKDAIKIGEDFKIKVNERYRLLEIDIDNVFRRLLLHAKKKYAAMNVTFDKAGNETQTLEVKGLDMRRREYCPLSKEVSEYVLNKVLSDEEPEDALNEVYAYLTELTKKVKENQIPAPKFKINTKLSKDPKAYPGGKNMPAVQVALRLREQGKVINAGTVITFVITDSEGSTPAERARALAEVLAKNSNMKPDPKYYLEKQILAPVERLLDRIDGIDLARLSESLGIEYRRTYQHRAGDSSDILQPLESTISDAERFKSSVPLKINCHCGASFKFGGIVASHDYMMTFNGVQCKKCSKTLSCLQLSSQLERTIRGFISQYYQGVVACDDSTCGMTTKQISVYGKRCLNHGCKGVMRYKYSDKDLYNQLLYFDSLFDVEKNKSQKIKPLYDPEDKTKPEPLIKGQIDALSEQNRDLFEVQKGVVQRYLSDCGRRYVNMASIFDFMK